MTRKIGISLRDELYEWATRQVEDGKADSVSALVAEGLEALEARAELESLVADLRAELGEPNEADREQLAQALAAADEAQRRGAAARREQVA